MRVKEFKPANDKMRPKIGVYSFGTITDGGPNAQFEFDVSTFRDPAGQKQFAGALGIDPDVRDWVCEDRRVPAIVNMCEIIAEDLIRPHAKGEGTETLSQWLSFAFKDHHGKWIAPAIAEAVSNKLSEAGFIVITLHHDIPKPELIKRDLLVVGTAKTAASTTGATAS